MPAPKPVSLASQLNMILRLSLLQICLILCLRQGLLLCLCPSQSLLEVQVVVSQNWALGSLAPNLLSCDRHRLTSHLFDYSTTNCVCVFQISWSSCLCLFHRSLSPCLCLFLCLAHQLSCDTPSLTSRHFSTAG